MTVEETAKFISDVRDTLLTEKKSALLTIKQAEKQDFTKKSHLISQIKAIEARQLHLEKILNETRRKLNLLAHRAEFLQEDRHKKRVRLVKLRNQASGIEYIEKEFMVLHEKIKSLQAVKYEKLVSARKLHLQIQLLQARFSTVRRALIKLRTKQIMPLERRIKELRELKIRKEARHKAALKLAPEIALLAEHLRKIEKEEKVLFSKRTEILKLRRELIKAHSIKVAQKQRLNEAIEKLQKEEKTLKRFKA